MATLPFVDYYEVLQLSPNATSETVERVYRMLAKRFHPDNQDSGDAQRFAEVQRAYDTLSDPPTRAAYDVKYDENRALTWKVFRQDGAERSPCRRSDGCSMPSCRSSTSRDAATHRTAASAP